MPVDQKVMRKLQKEYRAKKGKPVYYALENKGKIKPKGIKKNGTR